MIDPFLLVWSLAVAFFIVRVVKFFYDPNGDFTFPLVVVSLLLAAGLSLVCVIAPKYTKIVPVEHFTFSKTKNVLTVEVEGEPDPFTFTNALMFNHVNEKTKLEWFEEYNHFNLRSERKLRIKQN